MKRGQQILVGIKKKREALLPFVAEQQWHYMGFLFVGGVNTVFGYLCYAASVGLLHLPLPWALLLSQIAGLLFNFQSYGRLVFRGHTPTQQGLFTFARFLIAYGGTYLLNLGLLKALASHGFSPYLAQALALLVVVPTSYLLLRFWVWRRETFGRI